MRPPAQVPSFAEKLGFLGRRVETPDGVASGLSEAMSADRPVLLDVRADPNVVALPPHATWEQTTNFFSALVKAIPTVMPC